MSDASSVIAFLALAMSGIGIIVSLLARRDSGRSAIASEKSAEAAEKSANEAERTVHIAQTDLLAAHFLNVDYIFDMAEGKDTTGNYKENSGAGRQSAKYLKNIIQNESFHNLMGEVLSIFDKITVSIFTASVDGTGMAELRARESRAALLRADYEEIKRNLLGMKVK